MEFSAFEFDTGKFPKLSGKFYEIVRFLKTTDLQGNLLFKTPLPRSSKHFGHVNLTELEEETMYKITDSSGNVIKWIQSFKDISGMTMEELGKLIMPIVFEPNQIYVNS